MSFKITILQKGEINDLLALQKENLKANISAETVASQGYVSFLYAPTDIETMMDLPQIIAKDGDIIIGYALSCSYASAQHISLMKPMAELAQTLHYQDKKIQNTLHYFIGQVCVKDGYRGQGVFDALYQGHKKYLSEIYDYTLTEIAIDNPRSLAAHKRIGFDIIYEYYDDFHQKDWAIVAFDLKR
jgi:hypothetical protein